MSGPDTSLPPAGRDGSQPFITQFPSPPSNFTAAVPPTSPHQDTLPPAGFSAPRGSPNRPPSPPFTGDNTFSQPAQATNTGDVNLLPHGFSSIPPPVVSPVMPAVSRMPPPPPRVDIAPPPPAAPQQVLGPPEIAQAQKLAKFAISALTYDDIKTARENLLKALDTLGYNRSNNFGF
jgi:vacuolar protein sorting-associated protein VTA1